MLNGLCWLIASAIAMVGTISASYGQDVDEIDRLSLYGQPVSLLITDEGARALIGTSDPNAVHVVDLQTGRRLATIILNFSPTAIGASLMGDIAIAAGSTGELSRFGQIASFDLRSFRVLRTADVVAGVEDFGQPVLFYPGRPEWQ